MNPPNRSKQKQIAKLQTEIDALQKRVNELDRWFLRNVMSKDWTAQTSRYWVLQSRIDEKTEQCNRLAAGKHRLRSYRHEYTTTNRTP